MSRADANKRDALERFDAAKHYLKARVTQPACADIIGHGLGR